MIRTIRIIVLTVLLLVPFCALAQEPVVIKETPASKALNDLTQRYNRDQQTIDTTVKQNRSAFDASNLALNKSLQEKQRALTAAVRADKKYKSQIAEIDTIQKQILDLTNQTEQNMDRIMGQVVTDRNVAGMKIDGLIPVVRQENHLPDDAQYDRTTQKWTIPPATKPEAKK